MNREGPQNSIPEEDLFKKYEAEELVKSVEGNKSYKISDIPVGRTLTVKTANTTYELEHRPDGFFMSGSQKYCPEPTKISIAGCTFGGSILKVGFIQEGMHLEFSTQNHPGPITTSVIQSISDDEMISLSA